MLKVQVSINVFSKLSSYIFKTFETFPKVYAMLIEASWANVLKKHWWNVKRRLQKYKLLRMLRQHKFQLTIAINIPVIL